jgi:hypothetical protein
MTDHGSMWVMRRRALRVRGREEPLPGRLPVGAMGFRSSDRRVSAALRTVSVAAETAWDTFCDTRSATGGRVPSLLRAWLELLGVTPGLFPGSPEVLGATPDLLVVDGFGGVLGRAASAGLLPPSTGLFDVPTLLRPSFFAVWVAGFAVWLTFFPVGVVAFADWLVAGPVKGRRGASGWSSVRRSAIRTPRSAGRR